MRGRTYAAMVAVTASQLVAATAARAAGDGDKIGENIGDMLGGWARGLYVGIAALIALMFLLNRRFADLAIFVVAAIVVGGFVLVPGEVSGVVRDIWQTITA